MAHQWYGYLLSALGRFDEAIAEMKASNGTRSAFFEQAKLLGATFYRAARYDEALEHFREVPDADVNSAYRITDGCDLRAKRNAERGCRRNANSIENQAPKRTRRNRSGRIHFVRVLLGQEDSYGEIPENQRQVKDGLVPLAVTIAGDYALLGETKKAFEWLEKSPS